MENKLKIGKIVGTHGLKGEIKIKSNSSFNNERFKAGNTVYISNDQNDYIPLVCATHRTHKNMELVTFKGLNHINDVEKYRNFDVYALYDVDLLEEGEYFYKDIIGCQVYDQNNELLGNVVSIMENPLYDILEVIKKDNKKILIPYIHQFVIEEDIYNKFIKVNLIEGM